LPFCELTEQLRRPLERDVMDLRWMPSLERLLRAIGELFEELPRVEVLTPRMSSEWLLFAPKCDFYFFLARKLVRELPCLEMSSS